MDNKQIQIRDFGEKVAYLVGTRGKSGLYCDLEGALPTGVPVFKSAAAFAKRLGVDAAVLNQWKEDVGRPCRYRLAPKMSEVEAVAQIFGIWPKSDVSDLRTFWKEVWPSWYSGEAEEQYTVDYVRPKASGGKPAGDGKPDSLDAFQKAYCEALRQYQEALRQRCDNSISISLYFPLIRDPEAVAKAVRELVNLLRPAPQVLVRLQCQTGMNELPIKFPLSETVGDEAIRASVEWLLLQDIDVVIGACQQAYSEILHEASGKQIASECAVLVALTQRIVPAVYNNFAVTKIKSVLGEEIGGLVELPVHHRTIADVVVAAAEMRATSYLPRKNRDDWPIGTRSFVDHTPDSGFDDEEQKTRDIQAQLARPLTAASEKAVYEALRSYVAGGTYYRPEPGTDFEEEDKFELAGEIIKNKMKFEGRKFYMMFYLPKSEEARAALNSLVDKLKKKLPGMLFLALKDDKSVAKTEIRNFQPFVWMLPVESAEGQA